MARGQFRRDLVCGCDVGCCGERSDAAASAAARWHWPPPELCEERPGMEHGAPDRSPFPAAWASPAQQSALLSGLQALALPPFVSRASARPTGARRPAPAALAGPPCPTSAFWGLVTAGVGPCGLSVSLCVFWCASGGGAALHCRFWMC
jgi:hypothetical protein